MKHGYARVSVRSQLTDSQVADLTAYGCDRIWVDHGVSGKLARRAELEKCLAAMQAGDVFVITRLSRAMRNLRHLLALADDLRERGIDLVVLKQDIDTRTATGRLLFHILAAIDEWQRELIVETTCEGLDAARANGKVLGGKPKLTESQRTAAVRMRAGGMSVEEISAAFGCHVSTIYRELARARAA